MIQFFTDINPLYFLALAPFGVASGLILGGVGLGLQGLSALFNRESKESKQKKLALAKLARTQAGVAKAGGERAESLFRQGQPIIAQVTQQLQALLSGDRTALTQRFGPQLEQLTQQRSGAERRIQEAGPAGGGTVQSLLELEKADFGARSQLLQGAPTEATAGLTQLLNLLLGSSTAQASAAASSASVAGAAIEGGITAERGTRALNTQLLEALGTGAESFGTLLATEQNKETTPK